MQLIIRNGTVITQSDLGTINADIVVVDGRITAVQSNAAQLDSFEEIDAAGCIITPGFVQTHVHLCQTVFSGLAEDLDVMSWLDQWIWPLEKLLDAPSMTASARLGIAEMLLSGTTSFLSMETVQNTDQAFEAALDLGARATIGKAVMDREEPGTNLLGETTEEALADVLRLIEVWHGRDDDRLRVAVSPRAPSAATPELWAKLSALAKTLDLTIHTHVNENRGQSDNVSAVNGKRDIALLDDLDALGERTVLAHCVWLEDDEVALLASSGTSVAHCPTANLKLGSGIATVPRLTANGVNISVGIDGAACNNSLDILREVRLAALIHRAHGGAAAVTSQQALNMATTNGARALGLQDQVGAITPGMLADIVIHETPQYFDGTGESAVDHLVFSANQASVRTVLVGGKVVVDNHALVNGDVAEIRETAAQTRRSLLSQLSAAAQK
jgi:5-methylthioadenosine/S-adenosylhomocysteine deaminase